jgi:hemerythrin-like domain-containing protein
MIGTMTTRPEPAATRAPGAGGVGDAGDTAITRPLRDEHAALQPYVEQLRTTADAVGQASPEALRALVDAAHDFLAHHLIPHAQAEDEALYPVVGRLLGAPQATAVMSREHAVLARLTRELAALRAALAGPALRDDQAAALRRVLYGLYALVQTHFGNEEEVYLPLLEAGLTPAEAAATFAAMEAAARRAAAVVVGDRR